MGIANGVYQFDENARTSWAEGSCQVVALDKDQIKCGSGSKAQDYYQSLITVILSSSDTKIKGAETITNFTGVALKYPSWRKNCGGDNCAANKFCFADKAEANSFLGEFEIGDSYSCYFDPSGWGNIAMVNNGSPLAALWTAGIVLLALVPALPCLCFFCCGAKRAVPD